MILYSRLRSLFTRCIAAFVSSPERATTGALRTGLVGAAGATDADGGAVKEPIVGATKASAPNEYPPGGAARSVPAAIGDTILDSNAACFAAFSAHTIAPHTAVATSSWALPCFGWVTVSLSLALMVRSRLVS